MSTIIDPRLPTVPAIGVSYDDTEVAYENIQELAEVIETEGAEIEFLFDEESFEVDDGELLDPPSTFTVISQTVKVGTGGTQTVDIVLDITDVPGASEYERRIAV